MTQNPLKPGYSRDTISANIAEMVAGGMTSERASAAAYRAARQAYRARFAKGPFPAYLRARIFDPLAAKKNPKITEAMSHKLRRAAPELFKHLTDEQIKTAARRLLPVLQPIFSNPIGEEEAKRGYEAFREESPEGAIMVSIPDPPKTVWELGRILAVAYETTIKGKKIRFKHDFKPSNAPHLAVSPNGRALFFAGGKYRVTYRGIEDE